MVETWMRDHIRRLGPSRLSLVALGIVLGYLARLTFGGPAVEELPQNVFHSEIVEPDPDDTIDLPLLKTGQEDPGEEDSSGMVPPISVPRPLFSSRPSHVFAAHDPAFDHGETAVFEPHGEQLCASGCALSRHPTDQLARHQFEKLLSKLADQPLDETNGALEELLYFGPQTLKLMQAHGAGNLSDRQAEFLWSQLQYTHAKISLRVVDQGGEIRTWLEPTRVPLDRRHVFSMETNDLQPLVTSGTVKRVGLNHLWTRL